MIYNIQTDRSTDVHVLNVYFSLVHAAPSTHLTRKIASLKFDLLTFNMTMCWSSSCIPSTLHHHILLWLDGIAHFRHSMTAIRDRMFKECCAWLCWGHKMGNIMSFSLIFANFLSLREHWSISWYTYAQYQAFEDLHSGSCFLPRTLASCRSESKNIK